ncbi:hypothetical protein [Halarcobacter anaerophilus]|uniref:Uncharacterized protein n=1 Tax=Halarcobacter anaerophilus TaxID=877500 RepID=A0A4Q0Y0R4_9BACT|nr:hypothetical protein [Halarcobacter anaerophilus]QDF28982.1 hypothetical protein AANAER_1502 [Halarcobacter anaerophilus]RXJ63617.1 hypothetical protein CRV06_05335 [Halarcobacter anaerophilus]
MSNEKEIREAFKKLLDSKFPKGFTFDEFSGGALRTRPDLATFLPNHIVFTEIKSNKDNLSRLDNQTGDYTKFADHVYVILDEKHHKQWWSKYRDKYTTETVYFYKNENFYYANEKLDREIEELYFYEYPSNNSKILTFLWKEEKYPFTSFIKGRTKILNDELVIQSLYTEREIIDMSHYILYDRAKNRAGSKSGKAMTYNCGWYDRNIPYKEHRQSLFNQINCEKAKKLNKKEQKIKHKSSKDSFPWIN